MLRILALLFFAGPCLAQPALKELSPVKKEIPPPEVPTVVDMAKYRFYAVDGYTGPVTWIVDGTSCGIKEVATPLTLFGVVQGQDSPGEYPIPAGAVIVWGKPTKPGESTLTKVQALGVVDGKATILLSLAFQTGPAPPVVPVVPPIVPVVPPVDPVKPPVTSFRVIFVTESATTLTAQQTAVSGAQAVRDYLLAKTTAEGGVAGWRNYDPNTGAVNEFPGLKAMWLAAKPEIKTVPCMVVQLNGKVDILPFPKDSAEALATLQTYGGK